jgi:hypothetical protein
MNLTKYEKEAKLHLIKIIHTLIWVFFNFILFYMLYAVIVNKLDSWFWICFGVIVLEGLTLIFFKMICPLTIIARNYSDLKSDNFDIYLPNWLAKYTKLIYTGIFILPFIIKTHKPLK